MSAPIHYEDKFDDERTYAPPWARERPPGDARRPQLTSSPPMAPGAGGLNVEWPLARPQRTESPPMAPGIGGHNIGWPAHGSRLPPFEGDIAIRELRHRLSLHPEIVPDPPLYMRRKSVLPGVARLSLVFTAAAVIAYGFAVVSLPQYEQPVAKKQDKGVVGALGPVLAGTSRPAPALPVRLVVEGKRAFANEPLPLGVSLNGASGEEMVLLTGLAAGTRLSAGGPFGVSGWRVPARDLGKVVAHAPKDFVGVMDAAVDLRSPNDAIVDSQVVRLEWIANQVEGRLARAGPVVSVLQRLDSEEVAMLMRRGNDFLKNGDIAAARLFLRRAANAGNAQAALVLGATFDPVVLVELGVLGFAPDVAQARSWYQKATELGSAEASRRLERLVRAGH